MKPILFFGEALFDRFYDASGVCKTALPGGSVLNTAVGTARLEIPAAFAGGIGGDDAGRALLGVMEREGIERQIFYKEDKLTCAAEVRLDAQGTPAFQFLRAGRADESVTVRDVSALDPRDFSALYCAGIMLTSEPGASAQESLADAFRAAGLPVAFDLNARPALVSDKKNYCERVLKFMLRAQLLKFSSADMEWFFPGEDVNDSFAALCTARNGALTVLTAGAQGSLITSGQVCERLLAYAADVKDTTGCGDGYSAGLLRGLFTLPGSPSWNALSSEQVRWLGSGASAVAARVSEKQGAVAAMPRLDEVYSENGTQQ